MTILEFAKAQGITKNKAKYYIKQLPLNMTYKDDKGKIHISEQGVAELLKIGFKSDFKSVEEPQQKTTAETTLIIEMLQQQVASLEADKKYLQELLQQAENRADYLTIQTLPFFKRKKALKDYNNRLIEKSNH